MASVKWSKTALNDLKNITSYLERHSQNYTSFVVSRIIEGTYLLEEMPRVGRIVPEFKLSYIREVIREDYRIVYLWH